jgi:hypothetical protein
MAQIHRTTEDLEKRFHDQVTLLRLACENFDNGLEVAALNIATSIRVLVHDTASSMSALTHMQSKNISFLDNASQIRTTGGTYLGLTYNEFNGVNDGQGGSVNYRPFFKSPWANHKDWLDFDLWWNNTVFQNPSGSSLSRKTLVLKAANQEGGAHIDSSIDNQFDAFRHQYSGGMTIKGIKSGIVRDFDNIPVLPAIRHVGFEILETLKHANLIT